MELRRLGINLGQLPVRLPAPRSVHRMSRDQITDLVAKVGEIIGVLREADPADRAEVYQHSGYA